MFKELYSKQFQRVLLMLLASEGRFMYKCTRKGQISLNIKIVSHSATSNQKWQQNHVFAVQKRSISQSPEAFIFATLMYREISTERSL